MLYPQNCDRIMAISVTSLHVVHRRQVVYLGPLAAGRFSVVAVNKPLGHVLSHGAVIGDESLLWRLLRATTPAAESGSTVKLLLLRCT